MKNLLILLIVAGSFILITCEKDEPSVKFNLLTNPVWDSDSLLANGVDASGPGGFLEKFKGEAKFSKDGTGYFGQYTGTWRFSKDETEMAIVTDSLPIPLTAKIIELTELSLKITTAVPNFNLPAEPPASIRMTFKVK